MVGKKTISKASNHGEDSRLIIHGILSAHGTIYNLIHEIKIISDFDAVKQPREINWKKTKVFDNSNPGRVGTSIYRERWR